jgi:hypothetical protein
MKRTAAAGTFALLAGGATLLLLASIFYSCRHGGQPHDMGTSANDAPASHQSRLATPQVNDPSVSDTAHRITLGTLGLSPAAL